MANLQQLETVPVQLRRTSFSDQPESFMELAEAQVLAAGHRSLVLRPAEGANYVIKISSPANIRQELAMHRLADAAECSYLRRCMSDSYGVVLGAGEGLEWLALQPYASSSISVLSSAPAARLVQLADQVSSPHELLLLVALDDNAALMSGANSMLVDTFLPSVLSTSRPTLSSAKTDVRDVESA